MTPSRRRAVARTLLALVGVLLGVAAAAAAFVAYRLRSAPARVEPGAAAPAIQKQLEGSPFVYDEVLSYRFRPHFSGGLDTHKDQPRTTNGAGIIGPDDPPDPAADLLVLGDSVAYGYGVAEADTFAARLARPGRRVWNASCPGWTTFQEVEFYERYAAPAGGWRDVVLCVCLNDLAKFEWVFDAGKYQMEDSRRLAHTLDFTDPVPRARFAGPGLKPLAAMHNGFVDAWDEANWRAHFDPFVARLALRCRLTVLVCPCRGQTDAAKLGGDPAVVWWPQRFLARWCEERHIRFVDAAPAAGGCPAPLLDDCHLSADAHARVAEAVGTALDAPR